MAMRTKTSLLYMFQRTMQANRKYIYASEKAPIYMLSCSKAPKRSKFSVTNIREKPADFFYGRWLQLSKLVY